MFGPKSIRFSQIVFSWHWIVYNRLVIDLVLNRLENIKMVKLFIGNCADDANADDLRSVFGKYGRVMEAEVINGKGFGFVVSAETLKDFGI